MLKLVLLSAVLGNSAFAANVLTTQQLQNAINESVKDYTSREADMAQSITGLKVITVGSNAQVTIEMKTDGMNMSAKYLCVAQGPNMACRQQQ